jgi:Tfp pilus assembly protein PilF
MAISVPSVDALFSALNTATQRSAEAAKTALSAGIDRYQKEDYEGALREFRRAIALDPGSDKLVDTHVFMANAYLRLGKNAEAEQTYRSAIRIQPGRADLHANLGNLYFADDRVAEAEQEYRAAYKLENSAENGFALGQAQLRQGNYAQAETQFREVVARAPKAALGYYGLGQAYARLGDSAEAERQFQAALAQDPEFLDAHADLGYLYADAGNPDKAAEQVQILRDQGNDSLADTLDAYIYTVSKPRMLFGVSLNFPVSEVGSSSLAAIDSYLAVANRARQYSVQFFFDKEMDAESVRNRANWEIGRAHGELISEQYNFGQPIPGTEAQIAPLPDFVVYDERNWTATVVFTVKQNSAATATLDPAHLQFMFRGQDVFGNGMDAAADEFTGMSGVG